MLPSRPIYLLSPLVRPHFDFLYPNSAVGDPARIDDGNGDGDHYLAAECGLDSGDYNIFITPLSTLVVVSYK